MKALDTNRPYVKVSGVIDGEASLANRDVTFFADPGAKLTSTSAGPLLRVGTNGNVTIYDLELSGGASHGMEISNGPDGIATLNRVTIRNNRGAGIECTACALTLRQGLISGNNFGISAAEGILDISQSTISENTRNGISIDDQTVYGPSKINIINNFIVRNGNRIDLSSGGIAIFGEASGAIEFNTVVDNHSKDNGSSTQLAGGITCANTLQARNNIVARNAINDSIGQPESNMHGCSHPSNYVASGFFDLKVRSPDVRPYDYHLASSTRVIDNAQETSLSIDFDGDARPQGASSDVGADEYVP